MTWTRIHLILTLSAVAVMGLACAHFMSNDEKPIALEKTPPAVQASIQKVLAGQKPEKITMEKVDGKTTYEVSYKINGQEHSADFSASGELLEQEADVETANLPPAVSAAILKKYPSAKIEEAAEVTEGGQTFFEADVTPVNGEEREMQINRDGSIRGEKVEKQEKPEK